MDEEILKQIFDELLSTLEPLETQSDALLQFLKAKGIATDEELAPFLEAAGNASNVRGRAARVRTAALISSALKPTDPVEASPQKKQEATPDQSAEHGNDKPGNESAEATKTGTRKTEPKQTDSNKDGRKADEDTAPKKEAA
jgi:hypothetical protein